MKNILVATDGSKTSNCSFAEDKELAECHGSKIKIIHVVRDASSILPHMNCMQDAKDYQTALGREKEYSGLLLDEALKTFQNFLGEVISVNRSGDPDRRNHGRS